MSSSKRIVKKQLVEAGLSGQPAMEGLVRAQELAEVVPSSKTYTKDNEISTI